MFKRLRCAFWILLCFTLLLQQLRAEDTPKRGDKIRVVVWDERQPAQKQAYDGGFLGDAIANYLKTKDGFTVTSVCLDDPEQGLPQKVLDECDVLVWWGHIRNKEVKDELGKKIAAMVKDGRLSLLALHSAHWAPPFVKSMWEVTIQNALKNLPEEKRAKARIELVYPALYKIPKRTDPLTPSMETGTDAEGNTTLKITLCNCVFPAYRADGKPSHMKTLLPEHPIAKDIPASFDLPQTEMYDENFHVPEPDQVLFEEKWDTGERFRSGLIWGLGKGKIVYFRPGHETYSVYKQDIPLKFVENTCRWLFSQLPK